MRRPAGGEPDQRSMENRLQYDPPAHESERVHPSSLCNPPRIRANGEQALLMNEGMLGAESALHAVFEEPAPERLDVGG